MRRVCLLWMLFAVLLLSTPAWAGAPARPRATQGRRPAAPTRMMRNVAAANSEFALRLFQQVRAQSGNLVFSPYSVSTALAMTYAGAAGQTKRQMARALDLYFPDAQLHPAFAGLQRQLATESQGAPDHPAPFTLHIANALWAQRGHTFLRSYVQTLQMYYAGGLQQADFRANPEQARLTINQWVGQQTAAKIPDLLPAGLVTANTRLVLTNAIYLNAAWEHPFPTHNTRPGPFTLLPGTQVTTAMMHDTFSMGYTKGAGYQAVELPYQGRLLTMVVIVPDSRQFETLQSSLSWRRVSQVLAGLRVTRVDLALPKFRYESQFQLARPLAALGMPDAFDSRRADFAAMDGTRQLFLQAVIHRALIRVDEQGTEAAAATGVAVGVTAVPPGPVVTLTVDRPFLYLIRDTRTGTILFVGRVLDPRA